MSLKNKIKIFVFSLSLFFVSKVNADGVRDGLDETMKVKNSSGVANNSALTSKELPTLAGDLIGEALAFIGILFFILMIYGGFTWMMARGNDQEVEKAKNLISAAVIGLVIVLSAYAITAFIGGKLTG